MNSEERFKKSLDELLGSKEFPFDEANWEKAREIIDASKRSRRRLVPFILTSSLFLLSLLTGFYLLFDPATKLSENTTKVSGKTEKTITPTETTSSDAAVTTPVKSKAKLTKPVNKPSSELPQTKQPVTHSRNTKIPVAQAGPGTQPSPAVNSVVNTPVELNLTKNEEVSTGIAAEIKISPKSNTTDKTTISENIPAREDTPPVASEGLPVLSAEPTPVAVTDKNENTSAQTKTESPAKVSEDAGLNAQQADSDSNTSPAENLPAVAGSIAIPDSVPSTMESIPTPVEEGVAEELKYLPVRFSIEGGMSYLYGWKNPGVRDANGFNPVIGINYFNPVSQKTSLSIGVQYSSVSNLSYSSYTSRVTRLKLGEESEVSVYTPVKIHYVIVPIRLNYDISRKNTIGIGCNVAYLLNVESEVETYTEKLNSTEGHMVSKTFGYTQGFKKFDSQLSVFYKRRLYPNLSVNAEVFYGLTDIKDNKFFNSNVFERNSGIKLTLVYNILKK